MGNSIRKSFVDQAFLICYMGFQNLRSHSVPLILFYLVPLSPFSISSDGKYSFPDLGNVEAQPPCLSTVFEAEVRTGDLGHSQRV